MNDFGARGWSGAQGLELIHLILDVANREGVHGGEVSCDNTSNQF